MENLRKLTEASTSHINIYSMLLHLYEEIAKSNNSDHNESDSSGTNLALVLSIEKILKEIAILKLNELEKEQATIETNAINYGAWSILERLNEEVFDLVLNNHIHVIEEYFALGYIEGYKMRKQ